MAKVSSQDKLETPCNALLALCSAKICEAKSEEADVVAAAAEVVEVEEVVACSSAEDVDEVSDASVVAAATYEVSNVVGEGVTAAAAAAVLEVASSATAAYSTGEADAVKTGAWLIADVWPPTITVVVTTAVTVSTTGAALAIEESKERTARLDNCIVCEDSGFQESVLVAVCVAVEVLN